MPTRGRPTGDPALKSWARIQLRAAVKAQAIATGRGCEIPHCLLPTRTINWTAPRFAPDSYVLDEIKKRRMGGSPTDPTNVRPAHHRCNSVDGVKLTNQLKAINGTQGRPRRVKNKRANQPATTEGRW